MDSWCPKARAGEGITCRWETAKAVGNGGSTQFRGGGGEMQTQAWGVPGDLSFRRLSSSTSSGSVQDTGGTERDGGLPRRPHQSIREEGHMAVSVPPCHR